MNTFKSIYPTKAFLTQAITENHTTCIGLYSSKGCIQFSFKCVEDFLFMEKTYDNGSGVDVNYKTIENFVDAIWSASKKNICIENLSINNVYYNWVDMKELEAVAKKFTTDAERKTEISTAKKLLTKKQIEDTNLGLTSVMYPMEQKMHLEGDKELIQMAEAFGDIVSGIRGAEGFGAYGNEIENMKEAMAKMAEAVKGLEARVKACDSLQDNIETSRREAEERNANHAKREGMTQSERLEDIINTKIA